MKRVATSRDRLCFTNKPPVCTCYEESVIRGTSELHLGGIPKLIGLGCSNDFNRVRNNNLKKLTKELRTLPQKIKKK